MNPTPARPSNPEPSAAATAVPVFVAHLAVRWHDLDTFNHVNNSTYLTYLEESRLQWMLTLTDWYTPSAMPVLAASVLNYRRPIAWPGNLGVHLACTRLGNTSITLAHRIVDTNDDTQLYCDGHVVMVWMNPATGKPVALPASVRAAAAAPIAG